MKIWAIVPVKPFVRAKSRLAEALPPAEREALAEGMFLHTLDVLAASLYISGVTVISRDTKALSIARDAGALTIVESGSPELNTALRRASEVVRLQGADGVLVVPADLPLLVMEDIEQILTIGRYNTTVVLAPDRKEDGTNALLVNPPGFIPFSFGTGSFRRHLALAEQAGATIHIYRSERIGLDIDTPADLALYRKLVEDTAKPA